MNFSAVLLVLLGVGFLSGLRAFAPLALVCWLAVWGWAPLVGSPLWFFGTITAATILSFLALGELIGDKLPKMPARIEALPLVGRMINGGLSAAALSLAAGVGGLAGSVIGPLSALAGAFSGYHLRQFIVRRSRLPDFAVALMEDFITIGGTLWLIMHFFSTPI